MPSFDSIQSCSQIHSQITENEANLLGPKIFGSSLFSSAISFLKKYVNSRISQKEVLTLLCQINELPSSDSLYTFLLNNLNPSVTLPFLARAITQGYRDPFIAFIVKKWLISILLFESDLQNTVLLLQGCGVNFTKSQVNGKELLDLVSSLNDDTLICLAMNLVRKNPRLQDKLFSIGAKYFFF